MKGIKRHVFAMGVELPSTIIADAGNDQTVTDISSIALEGGGSTTTDPGGITSWLWEIVSGPSYVLTTPDQPSCEVEGYPLNGPILFRLTVGDDSGNIAVDTVTKTIDFGVTSLTINSSVPLPDGTGTIDLKFGAPNETINIKFSLRDSSTGDQAEVETVSGEPVVVGILDWVHTTRNGQVTLDNSGRGIYNYQMTGSYFSMNVEMVQRDSGQAMPVPSSTTIYI